MKLYIKNMVCNRCIMVIKNELEKLDLKVENITLGEVTFDTKITDIQKKSFEKVIKKMGFELIDNKKSKLIENIKILIRELVHNKNNELKINLSNFLNEKLNYEYSYLTNLFSEIEGTTIEKYFINQKIEKVKELLVYDELTLSEISYQLNYSSVAHLSNQFKKITGLTPSYFKNIKNQKRKPLDQI